MAVLKAPLFSFGASGSLAKALVYGVWKGVNVVRSHVVPANPNTTLQAAQRTLMTDAVAEWHGVRYIAADIAAWNRLANLLAKAMSGFNRMVREFINEEVAGGTWERIEFALVFGLGADTFSVRAYKAAAGNAPIIRYGTTPTNLAGNVTMTDEGGGIWEGVIAGLVTDTLYYYTIEVGTPGNDWGRIGIHTQRTT